MSEQKHLLNKYISAFSDNGAELRVFLNEEITRLKISVEKSLKLEEVRKDPQMLQKTKEVLGLLNNTSKRPVDGAFIQDILKIQNLVKETER